MGRVAVAAVIESVEDLYRVRRGELSEADVRRVAVDDALVDTGATNLSMPSSMIAKFGLLRLRNRRAMTTNGIREVAIYGAVQLKIQGRDCLCDVTEVADGCPVLIGQVPLELMDLVVDHGNSGLMGNPAHADDGGSRSDRIIDLKPIGSSELQLTFGDIPVARRTARR